jgi:glycerol-3-phosphate dehydrogenase
LARQFGLGQDQVAAIWRLHGTRAEAILAACRPDPNQTLVDTCIPAAYVRWTIHHEWVNGLEDLVCRRLMLLYQGCSRRTLLQLAGLLVGAGLLPPGSETAAIDVLAASLAAKHGYNLK